MGSATVSDKGWQHYNIWTHSSTVHDLYAQRCQLKAVEMTCAAQAAELLEPHVKPGESILDVGCGSGYFFHSLRRRGLDVEYYGIDATQSLIAIGHEYMPAYGLPAERLMTMRIEDLMATVDHAVCLNVLSNIDNYHRPLERILNSVRKTVILRESLKQGAAFSYVKDEFLDVGCNLKVHVNTYDVDEFCDFIRSYGFETKTVVDRYTGGEPEMVIGQPHYWNFVVATKRDL
jgi:2-polyprenyl-3-methyl-5-hydroxy-6-metoxy-1,4-benzoquinol methylase